jgi:hypothetical protein
LSYLILSFIPEFYGGTEENAVNLNHVEQFPSPKFVSGTHPELEAEMLHTGGQLSFSENADTTHFFNTFRRGVKISKQGMT